jgi:hypothetical protein
MAAVALSGLPEPNKQADQAIGSKLLLAANGLSREGSMWRIEQKNQS